MILLKRIEFLSEELEESKNHLVAKVRSDDVIVVSDVSLRRRNAMSCLK